MAERVTAMKHANSATLLRLEPLLELLRSCEPLREKRPGIFYRKAVVFLHFHEDATGIFADLKVGSEYQRFGVSNRAGQRKFLAEVRRVLGRESAGPSSLRSSG
jgi:hypothetical protein